MLIQLMNPNIHEDAIVYEKSVIVMVQEESDGSASDYIERNFWGVKTLTNHQNVCMVKEG